ncbi:MAG: homoserine dehydrogenase [Caldilineales bacterium]|nr:homoserine dehydrogenase [Caldilineales bacterium]
MTEPAVIKLILIGFGSVHRTFARILLDKRELLTRRYGLDLRVVGIADSGGATYHPEGNGLDPAALLAHKAIGASARTFPGGQPLPDALSLAQTADYDLLLEASPVNLRDGEPALSCIRAALGSGRSAVLANKAPLVLDYAGLHELAASKGSGLTFSATVCGGLPVINVGQRDLVGADIRRIEGIFNSTTNYILSSMAAGEDYASALAEAQRRGIAETDPALDVEGWDTANKLVIIANAVLGYPATLNEVEVQGITGVTSAELAVAQRAGEVIKLVASAEQTRSGYRLDVCPRSVPASSFLGGISEWQMGIAFFTDIYEDIYLKIDEREPTATAAAMLRDVISLSTRN